MASKWQVLEKNTLFKGPHNHVQKWRIRLPSGKDKDFSVQEGSDFMVMVALTPKGKIVAIKQHYVNAHKKIYSLVAGYIDPGETKTMAARREFREEAGYSCGKVVYLGKSIKGKYVTGYAHYFLGFDAKKSGPQELEEAEEIDVVLLGQEKFKKILSEHSFSDVFTEVCAWRALKYLKKI